MAGEVLCFRLANVVYIVANESYGFSFVGYCWAVRIRTNSMAISAEGARGPPLSTVLATTLNARS